MRRLLDLDPPVPIHRALRRIDDVRHWFMYRLVPKHKYHLINTGLGYGYYDQDRRLLHGCFAMLGDWIEEEGGVEKLTEWTKELRQQAGEPDHYQDSSAKQADRQDEALALWRWWTVEKPADEKRYDELQMRLFSRREDGTKLVNWKSEPGHRGRVMVLDEREDEKPLHAEFRALEEKIEADEQAMLHRLIDIRQGLWT